MNDREKYYNGIEKISENERAKIVRAMKKKKRLKWGRKKRSLYTNLFDL
jgi:hypothetical protein